MAEAEDISQVLRTPLHTAASAAGQVRVAPSSFTVWRAFPFLHSVSSLLAWQFLPNFQVSNLDGMNCAPEVIDALPDIVRWLFTLRGNFEVFHTRSCAVMSSVSSLHCNLLLSLAIPGLFVQNCSAVLRFTHGVSIPPLCSYSRREALTSSSTRAACFVPAFRFANRKQNPFHFS